MPVGILVLVVQWAKVRVYEREQCPGSGFGRFEGWSVIPDESIRLGELLLTYR